MSRPRGTWDGGDVSEARDDHTSNTREVLGRKCRKMRRSNLERRQKPDDAAVKGVTTCRGRRVRG